MRLRRAIAHHHNAGSRMEIVLTYTIHLQTVIPLLQPSANNSTKAYTHETITRIRFLQSVRLCLRTLHEQSNAVQEILPKAVKQKHPPKKKKKSA